MKAWRLYGDQLKLSVDGVARGVSVTEVFGAIVDENLLIEGLAPGKSGDATTLRFSRYPASIIGVVEERSGQNLPGVGLSIRPQLGGSYPVSAEALSSGHAVANGTWYSIERSSLDDLRSVLSKASIEDVEGHTHDIENTECQRHWRHRWSPSGYSCPQGRTDSVVFSSTRA